MHRWNLSGSLGSRQRPAFCFQGDDEGILVPGGITSVRMDRQFLILSPSSRLLGILEGKALLILLVRGVVGSPDQNGKLDRVKE